MNESMHVSSLALEMYGFPPDVRHCPWNWDNLFHHWQGGYAEPMDRLFQLNGITRLSISVEIEDEEEGVNRLVAFVQLLRKRLLVNGDKLGIQSVRVRRRHLWERESAFYGTHSRPQPGSIRLWKRYITVACDNDSRGQDYTDAPPHRRAYDRTAQLEERKGKEMELTPSEYRWWLRTKYRDRDYTASDGGSQDFLITLGDWRLRDDIYPDWGDGSKESHGYKELILREEENTARGHCAGDNGGVID
ncbi:uncharacterized protein BDZ99DRAFT_14562 [Mytilinidion resinicola]|uniref:Uncharacterized protein n=1 Tax=Mytilinidion resinicola TaxID=574789 RepID=A0A6A6ZAY7_9PEZI|nr:uncharacterized protein BDZ99DRAFT_14562 [Mytilinidion resinicola]KAF2817377.1 hypothetical protein BDZ99DRAFT_14562 [Mytilinidion resinicola]